MTKFQPQPGFAVQAYRFALDPNAAQDGRFPAYSGRPPKSSSPGCR